MPLRVSARIQERAGPLFKSILAGAVELKAAKMGSAPAPAKIPPPLSSLEIRALAKGCQLPDGAIRELGEVAMVSDGAHV